MLALERKVTLHEAKNRRAGSGTFESLDENLMIREFPMFFAQVRCRIGKRIMYGLCS